MLTTNTVPDSTGRGFGTANPEKPVDKADFSSKDRLSLRSKGVSPCKGETCSLPIRYPLEPDHFLEWTQGSGVDPGIVRLNVETLTDSATDPNADSLFPIAERLNWQVRRFGHKARSNLRGWWVSGRDPLNSWEPMEWGCFKPDAPIRSNEKGKLIKYEHPVKTSTRAFFLRVTWEIGWKIAVLAGKEGEYEQRILQAYSRTETTTEARKTRKTEGKSFGISSQVSLAGDRDGITIHSRTGRVASNHQREKFQWPDGFLNLEDEGFWQWVHESLIPITLAEGAKKAGCLLTCDSF